MTSVSTILCIPGDWDDRSALLEAIIKKTKGYMFAAFMLMNTETKQSFELQVEPHIPDLREAFHIASQFALVGGEFPESLLNQIHNHKQVLFLIAPTGDVEALVSLHEASVELLKAGGLAIKVESTGVAYSAERWQTFQPQNKRDLFEMFVTVVYENDVMFSVGMHNLGLRDAAIAGVTDPMNSRNTLLTFLLYGLMESAVFEDGHTFSMSADAPIYKLKSDTYKFYPEDSLFHNPHGLWLLQNL